MKKNLLDIKKKKKLLIKNQFYLNKIQLFMKNFKDI